MKTKVILSMSLVGAVAACAHVKPGELATKKPVGTYFSPKPAKSMNICISSAWENAVRVVGGDAPTTSSRETETGYRVIAYLGGRLRYMADIDAVGQGTQTKVYEGPLTLVAGKGPYVTAVERCQ